MKSEKGDEEGEPDEIYIESMGEEVYEEALQWSINQLQEEDDNNDIQMFEGSPQTKNQTQQVLQGQELTFKESDAANYKVEVSDEDEMQGGDPPFESSQTKDQLH